MESDLTSYLNIIFYILAWIVTLMVYQLKKKHFDAGSLILTSLLIYSIASLYLYDSPYYRFNQIHIFPFIYMYLMFMIALYPILKYNNNKIKEIQKPNIILLNTVSIIFIISCFAQVPTIISNFSNSIANLLFNDSGGMELYEDAMSNSYGTGAGITNLPAIISGAFSNVGVFLFFYYLTLKKSNKLILIGLLISCLAILLAYIVLGQRGLIMEIIFSMIITYFALKKFFQPKIKKTIKIIGVFLLIAVSIPTIALTNSRFANTIGGSESSVYFYAGQANLYFNNYGLDNGGIRYGDRTFPLFKRMLGIDNVPKNFWERRQKHNNLKINDNVFVSFVGDFTLDYGPFTATLMFIVFTLIVIKMTKTRNQRIKFHQLILLHFVMCVCFLGGLKSFTFSDVGGNLQIIVYLIMFFIFWFNYDYSRMLQRKTKSYT